MAQPRAKRQLLLAWVLIDLGILAALMGMVVTSSRWLYIHGADEVMVTAYLPFAHALVFALPGLGEMLEGLARAAAQSSGVVPPFTLWIELSLIALVLCLPVWALSLLAHEGVALLRGEGRGRRRGPGDAAGPGGDDATRDRGAPGRPPAARGAAMQVLHHAPAGWYFLQDENADGQAYYLDVNCANSAASFSLLIALDADERAGYHALGRASLDALAARVNGQARQYAARDVRGPLAVAAGEAIERFNARAPGSGTNP